MIGGIDFYKDMWVNGYQMIDRASAVIVNARIVEMDATTRNQMLAEARVIRAMTYLRLVTVYDNILLDTIPTTSANAFDKVEYKPATKEQIYTQINADLDFAIPVLAYNVSKEKIGQGIARMLRAQSAMWMNDYNTAATHCDEIIKNGGYSLVTIDQVFGATSLKHSETMMVMPFDELLGAADNRAGGSGSPLVVAFQSRFY